MKHKKNSLSTYPSNTIYKGREALLYKSESREIKQHIEIKSTWAGMCVRCANHYIVFPVQIFIFFLKFSDHLETEYQ